MHVAGKVSPSVLHQPWVLPGWLQRQYRCSSNLTTLVHATHCAPSCLLGVAKSVNAYPGTLHSAFNPFIGRQASSQPCVAVRDEMWYGLKVVDRGFGAS